MFSLFELILALKLDSLLLKSVLFTKLAISLAKFACFNLQQNFFAANLLNFGVVIYLS